MGDAPLAYVETVGGVRVSDEDVVSVGKNDVSIFNPSISCTLSWWTTLSRFTNALLLDIEFQGWKSLRKYTRAGMDLR
jgi:hypothetical protein